MPGREPREQDSVVDERQECLIREQRRGLGRVLLVDGSGVGLVSVLAVVASSRRPSQRRPDRGRTARGLSAVAAVGAAGFALAVPAVRTVDRGDPAELTAPDVAISLQLISTGFVLNTVGSVLTARVSRGNTPTLLAAVALLVAGDILSALYATRLLALADLARPARRGRANTWRVTRLWRRRGLQPIAAGDPGSDYVPR